MKLLVFRYRNAAALRWPTILSMALLPWLASGRAEALDAIGTAVAVEGQVSGSFPGHAAPLVRGEGVVSNEVLRSQAASSGEIGFVDQTKLFVGPSSTVTLDEFVFDQSGSAARLTVNVSKGALRFISGRSPHDAYGVKTPLGSLGMRGTIADVVVRRGSVVVTDQRGPNQGPVTVTARNGMSVTLQPGQSAILTSAGVSGPSGSQGLPDFAAACGGCAMLGFGGPLGTQLPDPAGNGTGGGPGLGGNNSSGQSSSGGSPSLSDIRAKRDIASVAVLPSGLHLYRFRYRWSDQEYVGVMAQEVRRVRPDAVSVGADGYLRVNYSRLGLRLVTWSEWVRNGRSSSL